ncbi:MAG: right-handed parallel beta-helix repeat-containing protein [Phycisphaerae bacterium]|nr:right-handed parallel beta-helix repeat-containing protein [Phycisphaerae bacterium]
MKAKTAVFSLAAVLCLLTGGSAWGKVIYVDDDAPTGGDGASWTTAYRFLQDALTAAKAAGEAVEIRVAQGTYKADQSAAKPQGTKDRYESFTLVDDLTLLGGYAGIGADDPNARDFEAYETILSGDLTGNDVEITDVTLLRSEDTRNENTRDLVYVKGSRALLEGFTITGAVNAGTYVGSWIVDSIIRDCLFQGNRGGEGDFQLGGGALTVYGQLRVVRCSFIGNTGATGAMRTEDTVFEDCVFTGNYGWDVMGGGCILQPFDFHRLYLHRE